jgi:outer membrane protein OmpA-like peptidoglycan-associated protein
MEGGKEQNFWPGFVDALSNVVLVMIFVVVVFVVTLFYYSQKLAQMKVSKLVAQSQSQTVQGQERKKSELIETPQDKNTRVSETTAERDRAQEIDSLRREVAVLKAKLAAPPLQSDTGSLRSSAAPSSPNAIQVKTDPTKDEVAPGVRTDATDKGVILNFNADSTQLSQEGTRALDKSLGDWVRRVKSNQGKIVVTGVISSAGYSDSRRRAYYRTVAVRNYLIDAGVDKERVVSRVATAENSETDVSRVVVQYLAGAK